ncbi:MAG: Inner membrane ABC transporter permease protein YejB [Chloroflexi bacterium ADurb.Bin325]|nr:MAG: Inner membrane ABC transporter permease protein YejB [Chloroflexi bacterium ADurb.Bin325]
MFAYIVRRFLYMIVLLFLLCVTTFIIIQLPPGDYLTQYIHSLEQSGKKVDASEIASLKRQYGLDQPMYVQFLRWFTGMFQGRFGTSLQWKRPVVEIIGDRLYLTMLLNIFSLGFTYIIAIAIGIYSATHQYSVGDYAFTTLGFIGLATPGFLLALVVMVFFNQVFGLSVGGLFSQKYAMEPWSQAKVIDLLKHMIVPIVIIAFGQTAGLIRVVRGTLLDELRKQYVITARTKGLPKQKVLFKYPVRVALNPVISTVGWILPALVSGGTIVEIVLSLPTVGPLLYFALSSQDMYLAGTLVLFLGLLTIIGTFVSDMLLMIVDPRIRFERAG